MKRKGDLEDYSHNNKKPNNAAYWTGLAEQYFKENNFQEAIEAYKKAVDLDPTIPAYWYSLGQCYFRANNFQQAAEACKKAVELAPTIPVYWNNLGQCYFRDNDFRQATEAHKKAVELAPTTPIYWNNLGQCYFRDNDFQQATEPYKKAAELAPSNPLYWDNLGNCYFRTNDFQQATEAYKKAVELAPTNPVYWKNLGHCYFGAENFKQAEEPYKKAVDLDSTNPAYWNNLGNCYFRANDFQQAIEACKKAVELALTNPLYWNNLGNCYFRANNFQQATEPYKKAAELALTNPVYWNNLGKTYYNNKSFEDAQNAYEKFLEFAKDTPTPTQDLTDCYSNLCELYLEAKSIPKALDNYLKFINLTEKCFYPIWSQHKAILKYPKQLLELLLKSNPNIIYKLYENLDIEVLGEFDTKSKTFNEIILPISKHLLKNIPNNTDNNSFTKNDILLKLADNLKHYTESCTHIERFKLTEQELLCRAKAGRDVETLDMLDNLDSYWNYGKTQPSSGASSRQAVGYKALQLIKEDCFQKQDFLNAIRACDKLIGINPWVLDYYMGAFRASSEVVATLKIKDIDTVPNWKLRDNVILEDINHPIYFAEKTLEYYLKGTTLLPLYVDCLEKIGKKFNLPIDLVEYIFSFATLPEQNFYNVKAPKMIANQVEEILEMSETTASLTGEEAPTFVEA
jgi:tetratricopeptide (TPR) repeat protein